MSAGDTTATRAPGRLDDTSAPSASDRPPSAGTDGASRPRRGRLSLPAGVDPLLVAIFAAGFAFAAYFTSQVTQWVVMSDELQYSKLALNIAETLSPIPVIRGEYTGSLSQLYPLLTAPFYAFWEMPTAFELVHWANAAIMASTAIPAYLLAREVTGHRFAALLVAALSVTVPWIVMGTMIMTEVAAYPAFVWAVWLLQRALDTPSPARDALALLGVGLAFLARTQFLVILLVLPVAILVHETRWGLAAGDGAPGSRIRAGLRAAVDRHQLLAWVYALGATLAVVLAIAGVLGRVLGRYESTVTSGDLVPDGFARAIAVHLDYVAVGIGVVPVVLATAWVLLTLVSPHDRTRHAFAVLVSFLVAGIAFQATSFNLRFGNGIAVQDRYMFYVAPLLFVGMAACLTERRRQTAAITLAGICVAALLSVASFEPPGLPFFESPAGVFHSVLEGRAYQLGRVFGFADLSPRTAIVAGTILFTLLAIVVLQRLRPDMALAVFGVPVLLFSMGETLYVFDKVLPSIRSDKGAAQLKNALVGAPNWVDRKVGEQASVAALAGPINSNRRGEAIWGGLDTFHAVWLDLEFWNKSVDASYEHRGFGTYAPFHTGTVAIDFSTGALAAAPARSRWVVSASDVRIRPAGAVVARAETGFDLISVARPLRAEWASRGLEADGWTLAGRPARVRVYPDAPRPRERRVVLTVQASAEINERRRYTLSSGGETRLASVPGRGSRREEITMCVFPGAPRDVRLDVRGGTKLPGRPAVGLRITRIRVQSTGRACGAD